MIINFFVLFFLISEIFSLKTSDICTNKQQQCKGFYDFGYNYNQRCERINCQGKYGYECREDYCTVDKQTCTEFIKTSHLIKSIKSSKLFDIKMKQLQTFINGFKVCPMIEFNLESNDVCINGQNCFYVEKYSNRNLKNIFSKQAICPCSGSHSYQCGDGFCTVHSNACEVLEQDHNLREFKSCGNHKKLLNRKIKLF